jgi:hypothetical protein
MAWCVLACVLAWGHGLGIYTPSKYQRGGSEVAVNRRMTHTGNEEDGVAGESSVCASSRYVGGFVTPL